MRSAGLPEIEFMKALKKMPLSELTYERFWLELGGVLCLEGRLHKPIYHSAWQLGAPSINHTELKKRNANNVMDFFEHEGAWFGNGTVLYNDSGKRDYGNLEECAQKCLNDPNCTGFNYAYANMGDRGQYCICFSGNVNKTKANVDYQYYRKK